MFYGGLLYVIVLVSSLKCEKIARTVHPCDKRTPPLLLTLIYAGGDYIYYRGVYFMSIVFATLSLPYGDLSSDPVLLSLPSLVSVEGDKLNTTSLIIAEKTGIKHKNIIAKIVQNKDSLSELGTLHKVREAVSRRGRGNVNKEYYTLNEPQAYFLITLLENSEVVKTLNKSLIKAFFEARHELKVSSFFSGIIPLLRSFSVHRERFLYVMRETLTGIFKFGLSVNPSRRLYEFHVGNHAPLELVAVYRVKDKGKEELSLLRFYFQQYRVPGSVDWYDLDSFFNTGKEPVATTLNELVLSLSYADKSLNDSFLALSHVSNLSSIADNGSGNEEFDNQGGRNSPPSPPTTALSVLDKAVDVMSKKEDNTSSLIEVVRLLTSPSSKEDSLRAEDLPPNVVSINVV